MRRFYSHAQAVEERRRQQIIAAIGNAFIASGLQNADRSEYPDKVARAVRDAGGAPETAAWARELAEEIGRTEYSADGLAEARSAAARAAEQVAAQVVEETADTDHAEPDAETVFRAVYDGMRPGGVRERARERARRAAAGAQEWDDLSEERRRLVEQVTERSLTARRRQRQERRAEVDPAEEADAVRRAVLESVRGPR